MLQIVLCSLLALFLNIPASAPAASQAFSVQIHFERFDAWCDVSNNSPVGFEYDCNVETDEGVTTEDVVFTLADALADGSAGSHILPDEERSYVR